jgi:hypothetical protein
MHQNVSNKYYASQVKGIHMTCAVSSNSSGGGGFRKLNFMLIKDGISINHLNSIKSNS